LPQISVVPTNRFKFVSLLLHDIPHIEEWLIELKPQTS
jgi:hypothetical protein